MSKKPAQTKGREASAATKAETEKTALAGKGAPQAHGSKGTEPAKPSSGTEPAKPSSALAPAGSSAAVLAEEPRPQPRILVVDDEPHVVQIFQDLLAQRGYEQISGVRAQAVGQ